MSRWWIILIGIVLLPTLPAWHSRARVEDIKTRFQQRLIEFERTAERLELSYPLDTVNSRQSFLNARLAYKRIEWLVEGYDPVMARQINGPPVDEVEMEDQVLIEPQGFQVIESIIFPRLDTTRLDELQQECEQLTINAGLLRKHPWLNELKEVNFWDAMRLELARIATLGIIGYDSPTVQYSLPEAIASLEGCEDLLKEYEEVPDIQRLLAEIKQSLQSEFDDLDRSAFLTQRLRPLCKALEKYQQELGIKSLEDDGRFLMPTAWWIFDEQLFRPELYSPHPEWMATEERIALGQKLFSEPLLSGNGQRSCATCHQPGQAFTDGLPKSIAMGNHGSVPRNAPTLWNAALQATLFQDARSASLEMQIADVLRNPLEMDASLASAVDKLSKNKAYQEAFQKAYGELNPPQVMNALAAYLRSLERLNSRFDQYMRGNDAALNLEEKRGLNLFAGKAKCATCHFLPLTNSMLPPSYEHSDVEVLGVPANADLSNPRLDPDRGAGVIANFDVLRYAFKTPTLRNVEHTGPYMHNGVFQTLEEVVEFYDRGGGLGIGLNVPNQTLSPEPLHLSVHEKSDLVAFMKTLTDLP
ncbi:cytochrome c peroxidase [Siphonobacter curvatus]|uniref:Cytochrome-c peroxidase n=1 Tax=Siphonobacter curvatus TaxID=2094562 RepID=A0A2S7IL54_9BACT|nr:cytochrome c peroxidase [Siphonobacter curvatus]PQA58386.1 cytochrome-c peroxidase [Siphonobacter curvatus]